MRTQQIPPGGDLSDAFKVRHIVFVDEQGFAAEIEVDDRDPIAHHIVIYNKDNAPIATARTFPEDAGSTNYIIGRVAVLREMRSTGIGLLVMCETEKLAKGLGAKKITLGAQVHAMKFYEKCGYTEHGRRYLEEHCEHAHMCKEL